MKPVPLDASGLLRRYGLCPDKSLGQNFLIDEAALQKVVTAAAIRLGKTPIKEEKGVVSATFSQRSQIYEKLFNSKELARRHAVFGVLDDVH